MAIYMSRRRFLKTATASITTALVVGFSPRGSLAAAPVNSGNFTPFVKIDSDGRVSAIIKHFEAGQGTATGLTTLIAEELGVELDDVAVEFAPSDTARYANLFFGSQVTGGSTAMANSYLQYRQAGAAVREMLLRAAAKAWNVAPSSLSLSSGMIHGDGKTAPLAEFVAAAAEMDVPAEPKLKNPNEFKLIGNSATSRRDNLPKTTGTAKFAMDVHLDGQIVAVVKRSPRFGGKVVSMDASAAAGVPGFINAVTMPTGDGVLVYAHNTWAALQARAATVVKWDFSDAENRGSDEIKVALLEAVNTAPELVAKPGVQLAEINARLANAAQVIEREFFFPYLCHAPMETLNCTIEPTQHGGVVLHDGCQSQSGAHAVLAAVLELPPDKIQINTLYAGGSFGRRATTNSDYIVEAAIAFLMNGGQQPVKLVWSREDDIAGGNYRPAVAHKVRVGLDNAGRIIAWDHRIAGQPIFKGTPFAEFIVKDGIDPASVEGVADTPYDIPDQFVGLTDLKSPVTVNWWRAVGHSHTAYVMESMMDMAARSAGQDPIAYRLNYLSTGSKDQQRLVGVLKLVADKSGWNRPRAPGHARGVAVHKSFGTYVAQVAEIMRDAGGAVKIDRITCAVDCGVAVNPDIVKAQMEGAIGYGIGHVMRDEIRLENGEVVQTNFPNYEPLRISDIKRIDTHIVPSTEPPSGVGEPGLPPAGPALANAVAVDGPRVTTLPMVSSGVDFA